MSDPFENKVEDYLNKGLKAAVAALPVVGGAASEFFQFVVGDPAQERRDDFLRETFNQLSNLRGEFESLNAEALRDNEQFQATVVQAVKIAATTASEEKKTLLRNAIANSAIGRIDENIRHVFMTMIEQFTPMHVVFLRLLSNPDGYPAYVKATEGIMAGSLMGPISAALPEITANPAMFARIRDDLHTFGCSKVSSFSAMMTGGKSMLGKMTTEFGDSFLNFVSDPSQQ